MNHSINEWQDISLKKDVEQLVRRQQYSSKRDIIITWDLAVAVFSLLLASIFDILSDGTGALIAKIVLFSIMFIFIVVIAIWIAKDYLEEADQKKQAVVSNTISIKKDVDIFDNEICYSAMTASTFYDAFLSIDSKRADEKIFYYIETNYYINRCIFQLEEIDNKYDYIFTRDTNLVVDNSKIHATRLENIVSLMRNIRSDLMNTTLSSEQVTETKRLAAEYDQIMEDFVEKYNKYTTLNPIVWLKTD